MLLLAAGAVALAQNAYALLPHNYKLELENAYVRISRVSYSPGDKLRSHSHPSIPTIYVYVADGGPIRFIHDRPKFTIERSEVQAGSVRFNRNAQVETHHTEYRGTSPTEYLRVELKTMPGPPHEDARLEDDADFPWEDPQVRISRVRGKPPMLTHRAVLINLSDRTFTWFDPAAASPLPSDSAWFVILELKTDRQ